MEEKYSNQLIIKVKDKANATMSKVSGDGEISLIYKDEYKLGDKICFTNLSESKYLAIKVDNELEESLIYMPGNELEYTILFDDDAVPYSPETFKGCEHTITMRIPREEEVYCYRNLARNAMDQRGTTTYFPHATANVETHNRGVFAARNVIDGQTATEGHGYWPYQSWGVGRREDCEVIIHFGRPVEVDKAVVYLRADYPHDNYWTSLTLLFSDGTEEKLETLKNGNAQCFEFDKKIVEWIKLYKFKISDDPALFAALIEFEAYGNEIKAK